MLDWFVTFLTWLSYINLYPFFTAWNITGVLLFVFVWVLYPYLRVRHKIKGFEGAFFTFIFAFMWISMFDEISILMNIPGCLSLGWGPHVFFYRWSWKLFFVYFSFKLANDYGLLGHEIVVDKNTIVLAMVFLLYYLVIPYSLFHAKNFRHPDLTEYPRWFVFALGHIVSWSLSTVVYSSIWRFNKIKRGVSHE